MEKAYSAWVPIVRVLEDIYEFLLQDPYGVIGESPEDTRTKVRSNDLLSTCNNYFHGIQYRVDTGKLEWEELEVIVAYFGDWADSLDGWLTPLRLELEGRQGPWDTYEDTFAESDMPMAFELDEAFCKRIADFSNEMRVFTLMTCVTHLERKELLRERQQPRKLLELAELSTPLTDRSEHHHKPVGKSFARDAVRAVVCTRSAVLAWAGTCSVIACGMQVYVYSAQTRTLSKSATSTKDPGFLTAAQSFVMQVAGIYITLTPAFLDTKLQLRYPLWAWIFSFASLASSITGLGLYTTHAALTNLLYCVASVLQAFVTLQVVLFSTEKRSASKSTEKLHEA